MGVEVRKVETEVYETGVAQANRVDTTYELGAEVNGAWVAFATVPQSKVDAAVAAKQAEAEQADSPAPQAEPQADPTSPAPEEPAESGASSEGGSEGEQA